MVALFWLSLILVCLCVSSFRHVTQSLRNLGTSKSIKRPLKYGVMTKPLHAASGAAPANTISVKTAKLNRLVNRVTWISWWSQVSLLPSLTMPQLPLADDVPFSSSLLFLDHSVHREWCHLDFCKHCSHGLIHECAKCMGLRLRLLIFRGGACSYECSLDVEHHQGMPSGQTRACRRCKCGQGLSQVLPPVRLSLFSRHARHSRRSRANCREPSLKSAVISGPPGGAGRCKSTERIASGRHLPCAGEYELPRSPLRPFALIHMAR
jgi:hypothetical protein